MKLNPNLFLEEMSSACEDVRKLLLCGVPVDAIFSASALNDKLFQAIEEGCPQFREKILLIRPDIADGTRKEAPGYTYVQPFRELAERVAERARLLLSDQAPAEQTSELISLPIIKNN